MTHILIIDDEGSSLNFNPSLEVMAAVLHALSGTPAVVYPASLPVTHAAETGACMCTHFGQFYRSETVDGEHYFCEKCQHPTHNSRIHCGALR